MLAHIKTQKSTPNVPTPQTNIAQSKCPLCGKPLASDEYRIAVDELRKMEAASYENKLGEIQAGFAQKIQAMNKDHAAEIDRLKNAYAEQMKTLETNLKATFAEQNSILKNNYDEQNKQNRLQFENLTKQIQESHKKELEEKEARLKQLMEDQGRFREVARQEAEAAAKLDKDRLQLDLKARDVQITRFQQEVDDLKKQLTQSQSELKGEAGELDLFATLTAAFKDDQILRQQRGDSTGDLIHTIRTSGGKLKTPIVYDNKNSEAVTKKDIEKAKMYKETHDTNYVIIVTRNLPKKEIPNGVLGEKDGILIAHPSIIVELAKQIRDALIEIHRHASSATDRTSKETRLYEYVMSQKYHRTISDLSQIHESLDALQKKEEKQHQTLWKERKSVVDQLLGTTSDIETEIESIVGSGEETSPKTHANAEAAS